MNTTAVNLKELLKPSPLPQFRVRAIHQIEITSMCNLRCKYCTHPHMPRAKQHMDLTTFEAALTWAARFSQKYGQQELNLAGIGESTMHPNFIEYVYRAREAVGDNVRLVLATNGLLLTEEMCRELAPSKIWIWVSLHRPEKAGPAIEAAKKYSLLKGYSSDPSLAAIDWAGQVEWQVTTPVKGSPCDWVPNGRVMVMSDGRITACCLDSKGEDGVLGSVFDDVEKLKTHPYSICGACHLKLNIPGYEQ